MLRVERFLKKVLIVGNCWEWQGYISRNGYGRFGYNKRIGYAHRYIFEYFNGKINTTLEIDHLCRNRKCCNPSHLEAVTHSVNMERGNGGCNHRNKTHCKRGHEFTPENIYTIKGKWRSCRRCRQLAH